MILNEFFNLPQVFEKDMNEFDASGYDRYSIYMDDYDLKEKFSDLDDAVEAIEAYKRDDPKSRYADYNVRDLDGKVVWRNDAWQDVSKTGKIQFLPRNDQGVTEGNGRDLTNTPRDQFISRMTPSMDANELRQKVAKIVNSPGFTEDTILQIVNAGDNLSHPAGRYIQQAFYGLQYNLGKEYEDYPERVAEKLLSQFRSMLPAYRMAEATTDMPFGSVSIDQSNTSEKPQQYHYGTEPSDKEIRKQRLLNVRQRKQDLLRDYAQMGALRVELIHGINNDVFLNKDQLLDYFDHLVDDPELTPLEYAHENGIPTDGLLKGMLRRAAQLGVSALDVRKLWNSAKDKVKAKPGVAEGAGRAVNDKGLTQQRWLQLVQTKFPDAKIVQAKMIDGPCRATLPDGRTLSWVKAEQGVAEGMFGSRPSPVLPVVDKINKVARGLTPQNVEVGKQIIQANARDITRILSPQAKAGVDVIEQDELEEVDRRGFLKGVGAAAVAGATGSAMAQSQPVDASRAFANMRKDDPLVQHNKDIDEMARAIYDQIITQRGQPMDRRQQQMWMTIARDKASEKLAKYAPGRSATQPQNSGFPSQGSERRVSRNIDNFESVEQGMAEDGPVTIGSRLPKSDIETFGLEPGRGYKINNPKDWKQGDRPRAVQQLIPTQDKKDHIRSRLGKHVDPVLPEAKGDYVPPREANYDDKYQAMVRRVGEKARAQEKAKQQQPKAPVRESRLALLKQIIQS